MGDEETCIWNRIERGNGRPLVLLHGIGMSNHVWLPILDKLAFHRRVIAFDLPGFGATPPLAAHLNAGVAILAAELIKVLRQMNIEEPVDLVGNSLGGRVALEVARQGSARSVVAISPPGLWPDYLYPPSMALAFLVARLAPGRFSRVTQRLLQDETIRAHLLAIPVAADGRKLTATEAIRCAEDFAYAPGFWQTARSFTKLIDGKGIDVPCVVAYGKQDKLLPSYARQRSRLPPHTVWLEPEGWGHVPMWDDPEGVARLILEGTQ